MMIFVPFLVAFVIGVIILLVTWWFKKINLPLLVRIVPGVLTVIAAIILFYIGYVNIRGFEGAAYGILSVFLICFAIISLIMAKKPSKAR
ncbi:preprotein translocase subunit SecD [Bacillus sp. Soil768D1]|nr:preprotein translocase subunit SecD [Bacillus sp. Soil768D1]